MSGFTSVVAVLPVANHAEAVAWYRRWIGRSPDVEPMAGVAEWRLTESAWIQVTDETDSAGQTNVVVGVEDIDAHVSELADAGVTCGEIQDYGFIKLAELSDPAGNKINFVWENPNHMP